MRSGRVRHGPIRHRRCRRGVDILLQFSGNSGNQCIGLDDVSIELVRLAVPGPIPGAGLLSYIALGLLGLGSYGWKRLRAA
jgi:hypothetical protein